jgi:gliding motility-associated lipoprotein GldH
MLASCDQARVYDNSVTIVNQRWNKDSLVTFHFIIEDTISLHRFYINVRHNTDYPYSNIYFFMNGKFPDGHVTRDTIECLLADPKGNWIGRGSGKIRDNRILLREHLRFPAMGEYAIEIEQAMRDISLKGVEDIGIRIEKEE